MVGFLGFNEIKHPWLVWSILCLFFGLFEKNLGDQRWSFFESEFG